MYYVHQSLIKGWTTFYCPPAIWQDSALGNSDWSCHKADKWVTDKLCTPIRRHAYGAAYTDSEVKAYKWLPIRQERPISKKPEWLKAASGICTYIHQSYSSNSTAWNYQIGPNEIKPLKSEGKKRFFFGSSVNYGRTDGWTVCR